MKRHVRRALALALVLAIAGAQARTNEHGLDAANFDPATPACTDFFQHANGGWIKANPIPAEYSRWSLDDEISERNLTVLRDILEKAAKQHGAKGSVEQKIGDYYASAMDEAAIAKAGATPIRAELARVDALKTAADVVGLVRDWHVAGIQPLFGFGPGADMKDADRNIAYAVQGGLGLPDRDYYLRDDAKSKELRDKYVAHVARMLTLAGVKDGAAEAAWVLELETRLAKASLDRVALRDPNNSYHIHTLKEADAKTPHFAWGDYFKAIGQPNVQRFSLAQPDFFKTLDQALADVPVSHWQAYLRWHLVDFAASALSDDFVQADFDFHGKTLRGTEVLKPRWKRAIDATNDALGEALGQAYVARTFPPEAKAGALELVENLKKALRARLAKLDWMSEETKKSAYAKLDTLVPKIGYPDKWRDYSALDVVHDSYFANVSAATKFEAKRQYAKIDKPVDRTEWGMLPQTVNAYYNPSQNEIAFPAAQLQPPYFEATSDAALNYGGIGSVIGHELLHGFDDEGSQFDAKGNLHDWWTKADREKFEARTGKLVAQFASYVPIDQLHIDGKRTLGENIADLGGLQVAWDAYKLATKDTPQKAIDGLAPEQRFFLAYAQAWRTQQRDEALRLQVQANEHAPAKWRVIGPLSDLPMFAAAFSCKAGDAMMRTPAERVEIW